MKKQKYNNTWVEHNGRKFQSKKEGKRYLELYAMERAGEITNLNLQVPLKCIVNEQLVCKLIADFVYINGDGELIHEDVKGMKMGAAYQMFKLKKKLVKACLGIEVVEI